MHFLHYQGTPPVVTMSSASFEWFVGQSVILQCTVSSPDSNLLSVEWIFMNENGTIFLNAATDSSKYSGMTQAYPSLIIYNLSNSDVGSYTCTGTNKFGTGRSKTALALAIKQVEGMCILFLDLMPVYTFLYSLAVHVENVFKTVFHFLNFWMILYYGIRVNSTNLQTNLSVNVILAML